MVIVDTRRGPFHDRLVFFATADEALDLWRHLKFNEVVRLRHALGSTVGGSVPLAETRTVCIDLTHELDDLRRDMHATCRQEVRVAERLGPRIEIRSDRDAVTEDFLRLHTSLVRRKGFARPLSPSRLAEYLRSSDVLVAYLDGTPLVGHVVLTDSGEQRVRLLFSASGRYEQAVSGRTAAAVNRFLHWHEMVTYRAAGFRQYDFGGLGSTGASPVDRFKLSFGGQIDTGGDAILSGMAVRVPLALLRTPVSTSRRAPVPVR